MVSLVFFYIFQLPHTVISNSEKLTHPTAQPTGIRTNIQSKYPLLLNELHNPQVPVLYIRLKGTVSQVPVLFIRLKWTVSRDLHLC